MTSTPSPQNPVSRRGLLTGLGTTVLAGLAGCSGSVPGTGPDAVDIETTVIDGEDPEILWEYPPREDGAGIGYAEVSLQRIRTMENRHPELVLQFGSTIGGLAAEPPLEGFCPDWVRFECRPPTDYAGGLDHSVRIEPPGQWEGFSTSYDIEAGTRRTAIELRNVETKGTVQIPAVFDPGGHPLPERLHCSFAAQASQDGVFGRTVRMNGAAALPLPSR